MKGKRSKSYMSIFIIFSLVFSNFLGNFATNTVHAAEKTLAKDLFISEYLEGSSNNKAIELFNGTGKAVDLASYSLELYSNGGSTASKSITLSGKLNDGEVYVLVHNKASDALKTLANMEDGNVINFNGDDAIALKHEGYIIDVFGKIGEDPGINWGSGDNATLDHTFIRKSTITFGNTGDNSFDPVSEWDVFAKDYSENLGKHTMTKEEQGETEPIESAVPEKFISISDSKTMIGKEVTLKGVVTADNKSFGGGRISTYIQDETAGINVFSASTEGFPQLTEGQEIKVKGEVKEYNGLIEIIPTADGLEVISENHSLPKPIAFSLSDINNESVAEPKEGQLITIKGYVKSVPETPTGGGYNVSIIDETFDGTTIRVMEGTNAISSIEVGKWYQFTGILSQYNAYQVLPRKAADIQLLSEQPLPPTASGEYESTVASVVDGDTIHLQTPVLGVTKVRYVNVDTPETYHTPKNQADENQKEYGEKAKAYLNTLLKPGDKVIVKVGEEATDDYGRLLGQVIRKSDSLNTNLELVRKGYASTYFIWPVGDEADYNQFQEAVKEAQADNLGIWNLDHPLMELPFEFRAREQGKGLTRYVGDSSTKKYVTPEKWKETPVEKRVFFASPKEAEANGYTTANSPAEPKENLKLQLLSVNDLHGKVDVETKVDTNTVGKMDYLAAYLKQREATNPNTLLVHVGDMVGGSSPVSALLQDEPTVEMMEALGFDVGTVGNHEFDEGVDEMLRLINGGNHTNGTKNYDGINFPMVAANVEYKDTGKLVLNPYTIKEVDGVKVGFIGVATTQTPNMIISKGNEHIRFTDEAAAINKYVPELQNQGVEAIIVLAHVPGNQSGDGVTGEIATLANNVNDAVDVIFAAHNHVKINAVVDDKLIVQAWEYGKAFADVDLEIDRDTGDIVKKSAEIVDVVQEGVTADPEVHSILEKYLTEVGPKLNEVIGKAVAPMAGGYAIKGAVGDNALGNLIADGMLTAMDSDFALMNGGGIRDDLNEGDITWNELFNIQPFNNTLVKLEITGSDLVEIINSQFSSYGPDVSVGGFSYSWDSTKGKYGQVVDIFLPDGKKIDPNGKYTVTVNNYMYPHSSDKYLLAKLGENPVQGGEDLQATVDYVQSFEGPISYNTGRISEVNAEKLKTISAQLLSVNDLHGKIDVTGTIDGKKYGRADYLAAYLRAHEATNPNTLLIHAGDMVGGSSPVSALLQDEPTVEIMESLGFDVGTVGNHEFDEGVEEMLRLINGGEHEKGTKNYDGMDFPVVAANVEYKDTGKLVLDPYTIKEIAGVKVGFIGVATVDTPANIVATGNENIIFTDEAKAINKYVPELQKQGIEAIVVVSHVPGSQDGETATGDVATIANKVNDAVDIIFAAHNHVKINAVVDNKLIVQAWEYGKAFSDIDIEIDPITKDIVKKSAEIVDVLQEGVTPDPAVKAILDKYLEKVAPKLNEVVGTAATELLGGYAQKGEVGDNALGNLIADGMIAAMDSDFALMNGGGIRDDLDAGEIAWKELFNIQPFNNTLVKLEITGAELKEILNAQFSSYGPDVSVGGFKYTWDSSLGKYGQVVDLFLLDGSKLDLEKNYTVTVNSYMYPHNTDAYRLNEFGENPVQGPEDLQATVDYIKSFEGPIMYSAEKRISEVSGEETETPGEETETPGEETETPGEETETPGEETETPGEETETPG
ncbi:MAG: 5'-nucleotidase C-terminal domain-containing protein, partial [Bacillus sp. (in: firmicutes)]